MTTLELFLMSFDIWITSLDRQQQEKKKKRLDHESSTCFPRIEGQVMS